MKTVAFFNNKGGVGKTSLLYHTAHMLALRGKKVVVADLDPQANLSGMFLDDRRLETLWNSGMGATVYSAMQPLIEGTGDLVEVSPQLVSGGIILLTGDLSLSEVEDELSAQWPRCLAGDARAFRVTAAFDRMIRSVGRRQDADYGLIDVGPNLGAINRCALISADYAVIPIAADLFSIRGLQNVGPKLRSWRKEWEDRRARAPERLNFGLSPGHMEPLGYVVSRYSSIGRGAAKAFQRWLDRAPQTYSKYVLNEPAYISSSDDVNKLSQLKDYRSLMPMAQEARKPMFLLRPADGAIGGHQSAVQECYGDFYRLTDKLEAQIEGRPQEELAFRL